MLKYFLVELARAVLTIAVIFLLIIGIVKLPLVTLGVLLIGVAFIIAYQKYRADKLFAALSKQHKEFAEKYKYWPYTDQDPNCPTHGTIIQTNYEKEKTDQKTKEAHPKVH